MSPTSGTNWGTESEVVCLYRRLTLRKLISKRLNFGDRELDIVGAQIGDEQVVLVLDFVLDLEGLVIGSGCRDFHILGTKPVEDESSRIGTEFERTGEFLGLLLLGGFLVAVSILA